MPNYQPSKDPLPNSRKKLRSRSQAAGSLRTLQRFIGLIFVASAIFGIFLLATDQSLWQLAVSHALGLVAISIIDIGFAILNLSSYRRVFVPSLVWAALTFLLQLGDIATAPQYGMTMVYFARYLFGLWAFDSLLAVQVIAIVIGYVGLEHYRGSARKKKQTYFDMGVRDSRRNFLSFLGIVGALAALAGVLGVAEAFSPKQTLPTTTSNNSLPAGAVGNVNDLLVGQPSYFDYPSAGYRNILIKKADGSVVAMSMLCTHVCCICQYDQSTSELICPCHGSIFDSDGRVLQGPAQLWLPTLKLTIDNAGNITPVGFNGSSPCLQG